MLKKSYTGFIIWMILFTGAIFLMPLLPIEDGGVMTRIVLGFSALSIVGMMLMIYVSEKVFWFNGITYEEAVEAGSERRKLYALRHLIRFGWFTAAYLLFSFVSCMTGIPFWADIIVFCVGMVVAAFSTINIKL